MTSEGEFICLDKTGCPFEMATCTPGDASCLEEMYDFFSGAARQGIPPTDKEARRKWISELLRKGENFLVRMEGKVVAHAALLHDFERGDGELIIFVLEPYRNRGLGIELIRMALERARRLGLKSVWLTVESHNFRAIKLYKKAGFEFCETCDWELKMIITL